MRSKMAYVLEENEKGKQEPRKLGLQPIQREGIEYEFDIVGDLDYEHNLTIAKSRCEALADQVFRKREIPDIIPILRNWLGGALYYTYPPHYCEEHQQARKQGKSGAWGHKMGDGWCLENQDGTPPAWGTLGADVLEESSRSPLTLFFAPPSLQVDDMPPFGSPDPQLDVDLNKADRPLP